MTAHAAQRLVIKIPAESTHASSMLASSKRWSVSSTLWGLLVCSHLSMILGTHPHAPDPFGKRNNSAFREQLALCGLESRCCLPYWRSRRFRHRFYLQLQPDDEAAAAGVRMEPRASRSGVQHCGDLGCYLLPIYGQALRPLRAAEADCLVHGCFRTGAGIARMAHA